MARGQLHRYDIGTAFVFQFMDDDDAMPINTASTLQAIFTKPGGATLTKTLSLLTDGLDGKAAYVTIANDLDTLGRWSVQGYMVLPGGAWHSDIAQFVVYP